MKRIVTVTVFIFLWATASAQTTSTVHSGQYALQMTNNNVWVSGADVGLQTSARIPVTAGHVLDVSFWMKDVSNGRINVFRSAEYSGASWLQDHDFFGWPGYAAQPVWTKYEYSYTIPSGVDGILIAFRPEWSGSAMALDDVSVIDTSAGNAELAPNPGFETWSGDPLMADGWVTFATTGDTDPDIVQLTAPPPPTPLPPAAAHSWEMFQ